MADKLKFDDTFEDSLLARFIKDKKFFASWASLMEPEVFENEIKRGIFSILEEYYEKYDEAITPEIIKNELNEFIKNLKVKKEEDRQEYKNFYLSKLEEVLAIDISVGGEKYSADKIVDFVKQRRFRLLLVDSKEDIQNDTIDVADFQQKLSEIEVLGSSIDSGYDYFEDALYRTTHVEERRLSTIPTGFKRLDKYLGGGLGIGEMGLILGPPNRGKTAALINIAVGGLIHRKNVIYFGFEGALEDVATRFDMRLARKSVTDLEQKSDEVTHFITYFARRFKSKLLIKMYPTEGATVRDLDNFLTYLEMAKDFKPDLLIVDYLNIAKRSSSKGDIWEGRNYFDGKGLAVKRNIPLWSAVQAKVGSLKEDIVTPKDIAECTGRAWAIADVIIGLCQSDDEDKKKPSEMRWYLGKLRNRGDARHTIPMIFAKKLMLIEEHMSVVQGLTTQ